MVSKDGTFTSNALEELQVICAQIGLSDDDIIDLFESGVSVAGLLSYLEALASNRLD